MRVTGTLGPAWDRMVRLLFRPFGIGTWFSFGVIFFLQSCMEGGSNSNFRVPSSSGWGGGGGGGGGGTGSSGGATHHIGGALRGPFSGLPSSFDTGVIVGLLIGLAVALVALTLVALWLGTRGQMMAIRSVASGNALIGEAWTATGAAGRALFKFHLVLMGLGVVVFAPLVAVGVFLFLPIAREETSFDDAWPAFLALGGVAVLAALPFALVSALTSNFVAPVMLKEGLGARAAWKRFWNVARAHVGALFGYFILRIIFSIGAAIVGTIASFLTCCLGFLPVLHQTLMAPWYVFERAWSLEVLASLGPEFDLVTREPAVPYPMTPGYYSPYAPPPPPPPYGPYGPPR
jgi:hypothetical protein